jgi:type IV pilus assembly protein PilV
MRPGTTRRQARTRRKTARRARGFSLIEVLISIIILSIGLLGMVALQAAALQGNRSARVQSVAVTLARELADMLRGNKDVAIRDRATLTPPEDNPYMGDFSAKPLKPRTVSSCLNVGNRCSFSPLTPLVGQTEVANAHMTDWLARVDESLPGARVVVCFDDAPFDAATGLPRWTCTAGANATMMIKIGWTQGSTDQSGTNAAPLERATDALSHPSVVLPVTPGNQV